jgi:hypothetical protein
LEGQGELAGRFYEYPDNWFSRGKVGQPLETEMDEMDGARLRHQLANGNIELLKGTLLLTE